MKKAIILLALTLSLISCSSDDSTPDPNLKLTYENLAGKWYFKETIMGNGSIVPYTNYCPTNLDYVEFFVNGKINDHIYDTNCFFTYHANNNLNLYVETNGLSSVGGGEIPNSIVVKFTQNELHLQYEAVLAPGYETRVLVLTRD